MQSQKEEEKRIVWIKCRATSEARGEPACPGNQVEVLKSVALPNGFGTPNRLSRYKCTTCGRIFSIHT